MEALLSELLKQGVLGIVAALALWVAWKKDRQVQVLWTRWLEKTERQTTKYHELISETTLTIKELARAQADTEEELARLRRMLPPASSTYSPSSPNHPTDQGGA